MYFPVVAIGEAHIELDGALFCIPGYLVRPAGIVESSLSGSEKGRTYWEMSFEALVGELSFQWIVAISEHQRRGRVDGHYATGFPTGSFLIQDVSFIVQGPEPTHT